MIFDSCILIDISRQNQAALDFASACAEKPAISTLTVIEVGRGVRNAREKALFANVFRQWQVIPVSLEIAILATEFIKLYRASHGLDTVDAVIAASAQIHGLELATLNLKHFPMFAGLTRPY